MELTAAMQIRPSLAWQVYRMAMAKDVFELPGYTPLPEAMQRVFEAAARTGFDADAIAALQREYERFEDLVARHADSRATFDAMVAGMGGDASGLVELSVRRAAYRAATQVWGMQAKLTYRCLIMWADEAEKPPLSAIIQAACGLQALRPGLRFPICRRVITVSRDDDRIERTPHVSRVGLLTEFCSPSLPEISTEERGETAHDFLAMTDLGLVGQMNVFRATHFDNISEEDDPSQGITSMIRLPCEEFMADMLLPAGTTDIRSTTTRVYGCMEDVSAAETIEDRYALPGKFPSRYLGRNLDALRESSIPNAPEVVRRVIADARRKEQEFDIFRCRVRYPVLHTCISLNVRKK